MKQRFAFAGFRHYHILDLYEAVKKHGGAELVAAAEDDSATVEDLGTRNVALTHPSVDELLHQSDAFDVLAIGDYFGRRGALAIRGLELGKHVIVDKPVCTKLEQWQKIRALSLERGLSVGCQLSNRSEPCMFTLRRLIREGAIGRIHTVNFMGQHPLIYGTRPMWYFEEGKHGGTINDIAVHAIDILPWLLNTRFERVVAARGWNNRLRQCPDFEVCAQMMLVMEDGTGVIGDVSYLSPDSQGYTVPQYWRYTLHGDKGILETSKTDSVVHLWRDGSDGEETIELDAGRETGYLDDFLDEIAGKGRESDLTSEQILETTRVTLLVQQAAAEGRKDVSLAGG